ncbi:hypothetical protein AN639_01000 [Candidatus Epulonipiscium fishelsonii]|uniref:Uncharacterized protein n=1 Tax=Candidatus Epulonipiscium fishelsonii TaxID=77094 RepID=A0ACC8XCG2_9FIRM|nr:hypothetical protein AN396_06175 [Epulopiscium sp. SCG-B11WGA-EpuloA1]ONI41371.1 hypothetical protein AN639_01000 [Epulopiscium sp. SCG-B05WGA-EpuloA1]
MLNEANKYVQENKPNERYKPKYHISPPIGWLNDPNGLCFYNGEYHAFFQYHPYDSVWGPMHWGHAKSKDLIKWEYLPIALAPESECDKVGCFSGSAIEHDGKLFLIYTGVTKNDKDQDMQTQCIAYSEDGINFKKIEQNPVLSSKDLPENCQKYSGEFRDPKVFMIDKTYYMVTVAKSDDEKGQILMYKSKDLVSWEFVNTIYQNNKLGIMFECPDMFNLDGKDVLIMSPMFVPREGHRFYNVHSSVYVVGKLNEKKGTFKEKYYDEIDSGLDFYAPQTFLGDYDKRIMMGWLQTWGRIIPTHELGHNWACSLSLPRELKLVNNKLVQKPIDFICNYRKTQARYKDQEVKGFKQFEHIRGDVCEIGIDVDVQNTNFFVINILKTDKEKASIIFNKEKMTLTFDRSTIKNTIGGEEAIPVNSRYVPISLKDNKFSLNFFIDKCIVEIFVNGGEQVLSSTVYPEGENAEIEFWADGVAYIETLLCWQIEL